MKKFIVAALIAALSSAGAWQIDSNYQIVLPDKPVSRVTGECLNEAAQSLKYALSQQKVNIPIVRQSKAQAGKKSIYIGIPDGKKYQYNEGSITIANREIRICGNDGFGKSPRYEGRYHNNQGSVKALTVFMEKFLNTRFLFPAQEGVVAGSMPELPEKLSLEVKPLLQLGGGRIFGHIYDIANNNFGSGSCFLYGGHSHYAAVPQSKYGKTHPEYFSLRNGKRTNTLHYHGHCLSNPEVRDLIYKQMVEKLKTTGAEMVEVGPTDGNIPCECENCLKMPGGKDPGERLWLFHLEQSKRLAKEYPGKKMLVICYWPNNKPPRSFKVFPDNMMVEITNYDPGALEAWKDHKVKLGFTVYIYNWSWYDREGFSPKRCLPEELAAQVRMFHKFGMKGLYRCGFGEQLGLEGPGYYVYGKLWDNPNQDSRKLLADYCNFAFGKAAPEMLEFYTKLFDRQKITLLPLGVNRWSRKQHEKRKLGELESPQQLLAARYPDELMAELRTLLDKAESKFDTPAAKWLKPYIDIEFKYLELTAGIACCMDKLRLKGNPETAQKMMKLLAERYKFLTTLPKMKPALFGNASTQTLLEGGRMYGEMTFPFNMKGDTPICGRTIKVNGEAQSLVNFDVKVQLKSDEKNLYVTFFSPRQKLGEDKLCFYFGTSKGEIYRINAWFNANRRVYPSLRLKNSAENGGNQEQLKSIANKNMTLKLEGKPGAYVGTFTIPFAEIGGKPESGEKRYFNASYLKYDPENNKKQQGYGLWEFNPARLNWKQDMDRGGIAEF